jgi:hypothetical protein
MAYTTETIDILKQEGRLEAERAGEFGAVKDLTRSDVIVHVGKPYGAVSGWAGALFWQVWVDPGQKDGNVFARIDRADKQEWRIDASLSKEALLDVAKDRAIEQAQKRRAALLAEASQRLEQLEAVVG